VIKITLKNRIELELLLKKLLLQIDDLNETMEQINDLGIGIEIEEVKTS